MTVEPSNAYSLALSSCKVFEDGLVFHPWSRELDCCVIDFNSGARNGTSTAKGFTSLPPLATTIINASAAVGGILGVPIGLLGARDGYLKAKHAYQVMDLEGVGHNALWGSFGAGFAGVSGLLGAEGIMGLAHAATPTMLNTAFGGVGLGMNGFLALYGAYGLNEAQKFGAELKKGTPNDALQWLRKQVTLTDDEIAACKSDQNEMARKLQKKWNALELRVGAECAKMLRGTDFDKKTENAEEFILKVEEANFKQQVKYALFILIALVGTAAFIAMMVSTGPASPLFFAVGAVLWLAADSSKLHSYLGEKCWTWHHEPKKLEPPCQTPLAS